MSTFFNSIKHWRLPKKGEVGYAMRGLTKREWLFFVSLIFLLAAVTLALLITLNNQFLVKIPAYGGTAREGIVGTPRYVNPVLAISDADKLLTESVFAGLVTHDASGKIVPDMAASYTVADDGRIYTFTLKDDLTFHDGKPLTADDVLFTIEKIQDPMVKSPKRALFEGVTTEAPDAHTVVFNLKQPFSPFLESLTVGILPKHIWENISVDEFALTNLNSKAIGSGPFKIARIENGADGTPSEFSLRAFHNYALDRAYVNNFNVVIYANEADLVQAAHNHDVDVVGGITALNADTLTTESITILRSPLPRVFSLFFNQNKASMFTNRNVIDAINLAINKQQIVDEVLSGFGSVANGPIPKSLQSNVSKTDDAHLYDVEKAKVLLAKAGNKQYSFSISTGDAPELRKAAELVKQDLEAIGIQVELKVYEMGVLNQQIIRPREYEALLFGQIVNTPADLYSFWHSGERNDPGLNVALYANSKADGILESAPKQTDPEKAAALYAQLETILKTDAPAVFLYEPDAIYAISNRLQNFNARDPAQWFVRTDHVWKPFAKNKMTIN